MSRMLLRIWCSVAACLTCGAEARRHGSDAETSFLQLGQDLHDRKRGAASSASARSMPTMERTGLRWDLLGALRDEPSGAYFELVDPVLEALRVVYYSTLPAPYLDAQKGGTIGDDPAMTSSGTWERQYNFESNPEHSGPHARVFAEHSQQRVIVAFRGVCGDPLYSQCRADLCVLYMLRSFGNRTDDWISEGPSLCTEFAAEYLDPLVYLAAADTLVRNVQANFPEYAVLLVGHSLGGLLAASTASMQPGVLQAMTFGPTPFRIVLSQALNLTLDQINALPHEDLISMCDPFDCGINSAYVPRARVGTTTCAFFDLDEPEPCDAINDSDAFRHQIMEGHAPGDLISSDFNSLQTCKTDAHDMGRYYNIVKLRYRDSISHTAAPQHQPTCSTDFSLLQARYDSKRTQSLLPESVQDSVA